jgi:hypothetical protein
VFVQFGCLWILRHERKLSVSLCVFIAPLHLLVIKIYFLSPEGSLKIDITFYTPPLYTVHWNLDIGACRAAKSLISAYFQNPVVGFRVPIKPTLGVSTLRKIPLFFFIVNGGSLDRCQNAYQRHCNLISKKILFRDIDMLSCLSFWANFPFSSLALVSGFWRWNAAALLYEPPLVFFSNPTWPGELIQIDYHWYDACLRFGHCFH